MTNGCLESSFDIRISGFWFLVFLRILASGRYSISMLSEPLLAHAAQVPNDIAVHDESGTRTFGQLAAAAAGIAQLLTGTTNRPSVGLMLPAGAGFVASFYGTLLAGKSVVPINFLLGEKEIAHVIADSGIDTLISIPQLSGKFNVPGLKIIDLVEVAKRAAASGGARGAALAALKTRLPNPKPDDMAVLMYTSGTSGLPK